MFNFSANRRVYRLYDFNKTQIITPDQYYCVCGKVHSADKLYLAIESVQPDAKPSRLLRVAPWSCSR